MKADKQHSALEVIKKEQLKRRAFSVEFKAEAVRYEKAENLSLPECGRKLEVLPSAPLSATQATITRSWLPGMTCISRHASATRRAGLATRVTGRRSALLPLTPNANPSSRPIWRVTIFKRWRHERGDNYLDTRR